MKFQKTQLEGIWIIEPEKKHDSRGFFARTWCRDEFLEHGLNPDIRQCSVAHNEKKGTLRGMHFQKSPYAETKLVLCVRGSIFDVVIDLRPESKTFQKWMSIELGEGSFQMLYIPEGFAHGYQTLTDETELFYQMSTAYEPKASAGVRWNDPAFDIKWPETRHRIISEKDQNWPDFERAGITTYASL